MCKRPEQKKVLTAIGFKVMTAGELARQLLTLAREGNFRRVLEYLDDLRFTEEFAKLEDAVAAGALEGFFTVEGVEGQQPTLHEATIAWGLAGKPRDVRLFHHRWDGRSWVGTQIAVIGEKRAEAA